MNLGEACKHHEDLLKRCPHLIDDGQQFRMLWSCGHYDGPTSGVGLVQGAPHWFERVTEARIADDADSTPQYCRIFALVALTPEEFTRERVDHEAMERCFGKRRYEYIEGKSQRVLESIQSTEEERKTYFAAHPWRDRGYLSKEVTGWWGFRALDFDALLTGPLAWMKRRTKKMTDRNTDVYTPENAMPAYRKEYLSDSGLYKIVVMPYAAQGGSWSYSRGLVYKVGQEAPIADIRRNYSSFPFAFIEDHPNGHAYLVGGADYQGSTVIELDTGRRRDFVPEEAKEGFGFCWVDHLFDPPSQLLIVDGCIWAAPFEYRFYDFSDPMEKGWPALEFEGAYAEDVWPEITADGLIRTFEVEPEPEPEDAKDDVPVEKCGCSAIYTYRRHGNELRFVSMWLSQTEQKRRRKRATEARAYDTWKREFKATDPLYLEYKRQLTAPGFCLEDYESVGTTYDRWCPSFKGSESRWCRRILEDERYRVHLEWAVKTGPIKLAIYMDDKTVEEKFFDHSAEGMGEAFKYAKSLVAGAPIAITRAWLPR